MSNMWVDELHANAQAVGWWLRPHALEQSAEPAAPADFLFSDLPACSNSIHSITLDIMKLLMK